MPQWLSQRAAAWLLALVIGGGAGLGAVAQEVPLVDDRGRPVVATGPVPQRIVSLLTSLTETVCVLGSCGRLVGIDRYSNWPEQVLAGVPVVGGGLDPNVEAIVALKPDVVLLSNSARVVERLEALGLRTVTLEPRTQADVYRVMHVIGALLGLAPQEGAAREWQRVQDGIDAAVRTLVSGVAGKRAYFEVSRGPYVAGPTSFIGEMLERMGVVNVIPPEMGPFPRVNPEFILRAKPDVILMGSHSMQVAHTYPGWQSLEAVRQQRICAFDAAQSSVIVRPGPRMDEAARTIARCLNDKVGDKEGGHAR